jgi:site-specific recombinase XerD
MATLAPLLEAFFTDHLMTQRQASPNTVAAYRDTFRLLLVFTRDRTGKPPNRINITDWDVALISAFLQHLEADRANSVTTRNARLAAIHSLFVYAAYRLPEHAALIERVLAMPPKRFDQPGVCFLTGQEINSLLAAPDRSTWTGRRDQTLLQVAAQTGLRVSELIGLRCQDAHLGAGPHLRCLGKGRKQRVTPLTTATVVALNIWLSERGGADIEPIFCTRSGRPLSRDAIEHLVAKHAATAARSNLTLAAKHVSPHTLRHSAAMALLHAGVDLSVIALWLGHESTQTVQAYLHADMALKERALARTKPDSATPGRYHPPDDLLAFLDNL